MNGDGLLRRLREIADEASEEAKDRVAKGRKQKRRGSSLATDAYRYEAIAANRSADWFRALADALEKRPGVLEEIAAEMPGLEGV